MIKEELAARLNGREYGSEITEKEEAEAKASGLVVIFGYSDDLMEFRGAIRDESDCYESGEVHLTPDGLLINECDNKRCPYFKKIQLMFPKVIAVWNKDGYSWIYETELPHSSFDVMEDGEKYCRGIVVEIPKGGNKI